MFTWFKDIIARTPIDDGPFYGRRSPYLLANAVLFGLWVLHLMSPTAWLYAFFQQKGVDDGRYHTGPNAPDVYVLLSFVILPVSLLVLPEWYWHKWVVPGVAIPLLPFLAILLAIDCFRESLYTMAIRPIVDPTYRQYSAIRTFSRILFYYFNSANLFAIIYYSLFKGSFNFPLTPVSAWMLSVGIITGTGFSGIAPTPGTPGGIVGGLESFFGIIFISTIIGQSLSRLSKPVEEVSRSNGSKPPSGPPAT